MQLVSNCNSLTAFPFDSLPYKELLAVSILKVSFIWSDKPPFFCHRRDNDHYLFPPVNFFINGAKNSSFAVIQYF